MNKTKQGLNIIILLIVCFQLQAQQPGIVTDAADASLLRRSEKALTRIIVHDIFSPPVASRIYLYASMAAYEAIIPSQKKYASLAGSIPSFPAITIRVSEPVNYRLASVYAFLKVAQRFVFSEKMLEDSLNAILKEFKKLKPGIYKNSIAVGQMVTDSIIKWADKDNYRDTRKLRRYNIIKQNGKWLPTPPGYIAAVEPYWGKMRTIVLDSASEYKPAPPPEFSIDKQSEFYKQAYEVYETGNSLTTEQRAIAAFWDCNPFFLNTQGHLNFATKKLSPGGHWMSIAGIAAAKDKADLATTAAAYTFTAIALYDGFISCWDEKFRSNLIRPETFINSYINEKWRPVLQTPPFPEYTSGHSVISTAAATVLTHFFGELFQFDDVTEMDFGLPMRSYPSFLAAAKEAAISRMYGGIHYRAAIEVGQVQGSLIGKKIINKIKLKRTS
jgi:hypothetical protein